MVGQGWALGNQGPPLRSHLAPVTQPFLLRFLHQTPGVVIPRMEPGAVELEVGGQELAEYAGAAPHVVQAAEP